MTLDNEGQRNLLLQIIDQSTFTGNSVETIFWLKNSIRQADVETIAAGASVRRRGTRISEADRAAILGGPKVPPHVARVAKKPRPAKVEQ